MKSLTKYVAIVGAVIASVAGVQAEELSRTDITQDGTSMNLSSVDAGSDTYLNDERTFLMVNDPDTQTYGSTVTITAQRTSTSVNGYGSLDISDIVVPVFGGDTAVIAPSLAYSNDNGRVEVSYSGDTTDLSVGVFKRPRD